MVVYLRGEGCRRVIAMASKTASSILEIISNVLLVFLDNARAWFFIKHLGLFHSSSLIYSKHNSSYKLSHPRLSPVCHSKVVLFWSTSFKGSFSLRCFLLRFVWISQVSSDCYLVAALVLRALLEKGNFSKHAIHYLRNHRVSWTAAFW